MTEDRVILSEGRCQTNESMWKVCAVITLLKWYHYPAGVQTLNKHTATHHKIARALTLILCRESLSSLATLKTHLGHPAGRTLREVRTNSVYYSQHISKVICDWAIPPTLNSHFKRNIWSFKHISGLRHDYKVWWFHCLLREIMFFLIVILVWRIMALNITTPMILSHCYYGEWIRAMENSVLPCCSWG